MPKLPVNMVRRKGRSGYYFRRREGGRVVWRALGTDYDAARMKLRSLKVEVPASPRRTVAQAAEQWLATYVATARSPKGQQLARARVERYLVPALGFRVLERLTSDDVRRYRLSLEREAIAPQTVAHILSDLRCFLNWAAAGELLRHSPFPRRVLPRIQERPPDRLSDEEVARVTLMPDPYGFIARLGLGTGLRWGELTRAQSTDVQDGYLVVHQTKTGKLRRVPLTPGLSGELRGRVGRLVPYSPLASGAYARMVRRLSGVSQFHPHQMRHTFACLWLERGGSLAGLQQILGHSTIVTTQRYARLSDEAVMAEAARIAAGSADKG